MEIPVDHDRLRKIRIGLPEDAWHGVEAESVWAEPVHDDLYTLRNSPFYARNLSYGDTVRAEEKEGVLQFRGVADRGGHSTYRIFAKAGKDDPKMKALINQLSELHCSIEVATEKLITIDVHPDADIYRVYDLLEQAYRGGLADFEEAHCGHPLRGRAPSAPN